MAHIGGIRVKQDRLEAGRCGPCFEERFGKMETAKGQDVDPWALAGRCARHTGQEWYPPDLDDVVTCTGCGERGFCDDEDFKFLKVEGMWWCEVCHNASR